MLKSISTAALVVLIVSLAKPSDVGATKFAGEWLNVGGGARALALGGAHVAIAGDATAFYWNPAGLAPPPSGQPVWYSDPQKREAMLMHSERFGDLVDYNFGAYRQLLRGGGTAAFGVGFIHQGVNDIVLTTDGVVFNDVDNDGIVDPGELIYDKDNLPRESHNDLGIFFSYADHWKGIRWGGSLKLIRTWSVDDNTSFGFGLDAGLLANNVLENLDVGLKIQDLTGTYLSWSTGEDEYIAPSVRLGLAYDQPIRSLQGAVLVTVDGEFHFENRRAESTQFWAGSASTDLHYGLEFSFRERGAVRVGMDTENLTAGAGFLLGPVGVDYAYLDHDIFDATHRVSLKVVF